MAKFFCSSNSLKDNERSGVLGSFINSVDVDTNKRAIIVDWLMRVTKCLKLKNDTYMAAVDILDAFLCRLKDFKKDKLQLIALSSLSLSAKYCEIYFPEDADYVIMSNNSFTENDLYKMEKEIFSTLGCNINIPHEIDYLRAISLASNACNDSHHMSKNLLMTLKLTVLDFLPSVVVTSVRKIMARIYKETYVNYFKLPEYVVNICVMKIISELKKIKSSNSLAYKTLHPKKEWMDIFDIICNIIVNNPETSESAEKYCKYYYFKENIAISLLNSSDISSCSHTIGEGTFGIVKKVEYQGKIYAVKKSKDLMGGTIAHHFVREISMLLSLNHDNVIKIKYISSDIGSIFLDLGVSDLSRWIKYNGAINYSDQFNLSSQLFNALEYIHSMGCLHRDIKPANIIVFRDSNILKFVLGDFGSGRGCQISLRDNKFTQEIVTLHYRPPEILLGKDEYNDGVDVWSMLCTLYECATNRILFNGDSKKDQILKIFEILGTPTDDTFEGISELPEYSSSFPQYQPISDYFKKNNKLSDCYKELLTVGLIMDPSKRMTAAIANSIIEEYVK
jgi:hypothetical protein